MIQRIQERLAKAETAVNETAFLPPGNETRDAAVRELHLAKVFAEEWMV